MKLIYLGIALLMLTACVYYPSSHALQVAEVDLSQTRSCKLMGQVYGKGRGLYFLAAGVQVAKDSAKEQAFNMGATHVSWIDVDYVGTPTALGRAYRCT